MKISFVFRGYPRRTALAPVALLAIHLILFGCATPPASVTSSPTDLPTAGAATAVAPTPAVDTSAEIIAALDKTRTVSSVRYEITSNVTFTRDGASTQQPGLIAYGAEHGPDRQLSISGAVNAHGEPSSFEFVTLDGVTYAKGLTGVPGIKPYQWYRFGPELGNVTRDAPGAASLLADLEAQGLAQGEFRAHSTTTFDGQDCAVWRAGNPKLAQSFIGIANSREATAQLKALDSSELWLTICADGYIHRLRGVVEGHDPQNVQNKAKVELIFHLFDHATSLTITAPDNALEFQLPTEPDPPTPTP